MHRILKLLSLMVILLMQGLICGMESEIINIVTSDGEEFPVSLPVALTSELIKSMIEDIGEGEKTIPLPAITGQQFRLLHPMMERVQSLTERFKSNKTQLTQELQNLSIYQMYYELSIQELIEFINHANLLNIPVTEPALRALAWRTLDRNDIQKLEGLQDKLKDFWQLHPALIDLRKKLSARYYTLSGHITFQTYVVSWFDHIIKIQDKKSRQIFTLRHPAVTNVMMSRDESRLISWSLSKAGTIKVWDYFKNFVVPIDFGHALSGVIESINGNLISWSVRASTIKIWYINNPAEPISLSHKSVSGVVESMNGKLISWSCKEGTIKIWDAAFKEDITLPHPAVSGAMQSKKGNLISWSHIEGTIKVWDTALQEHITVGHEKVSGLAESGQDDLISWSYVQGDLKVWHRNNLQRGPITLQHEGVMNVIGLRDGSFISFSEDLGTQMLWDKVLYDPTYEHIEFILNLYSCVELTAQQLTKFKATFATFSWVVQSILKDMNPTIMPIILNS